MKTIEITEKEYNELKAKAENWDKLGDEIAKFYDEDNEEGDLADIGEVAAIAYGWL